MAKKKDKHTKAAAPAEEDSVSAEKLDSKVYKKELERLQVELCYLQRWLKETGERVVVIFEGRDAAGKGGVIKRITERVSPRVFQVKALPAPSDRERSQLHLQRYVRELPAGGEAVLFDRSWYNRAGVERVMNFCTEAEARRFLDTVPQFERYLCEGGIRLIKYFFNVSQDEQERRFRRRFEDPLRQWKLSPMDVVSWSRWWGYTAVYDEMFRCTDTEWAPWYVVHADEKRRARLNCIAHLLDQIPYTRLPFDAPALPKRLKRKAGVPDSPAFKNWVPDRY
jgi:polyphosphate kinase